MTSNTKNSPRKEDDSQAMNQIKIREATEADSVALVPLTRATPMGGRIALRIDREPDFLAAQRARGNAAVNIAPYEQQVIGFLSAAIHLP
jgi:hypothetical protein